MQCKHCSTQCRRFGRNSCGRQRYKCRECLKTYTEPRRTIDNMYLPFETVVRVVNLLVEGNSVRSTARIVGIEANTVEALLARVGLACNNFLRDLVRNVDISHLEIDEIWTFVYKKQKRVQLTDPDTVGDAYCYIALDRASRRVAAWHLGKRDMPNTARFILNVREATSARRFQIILEAARQGTLSRGGGGAGRLEHPREGLWRPGKEGRSTRGCTDI